MLRFLLWSIVALFLPLISTCATAPASQVPTAPTIHRSFVAFDIDGTLTPDNLYVWKARPDAAHVANAFAAKGYSVVYMTGRLWGLQFLVPWLLKKEGFPAGSLYIGETFEDEAAFKLRV